jgi:hypothetical protein
VTTSCRASPTSPCNREVDREADGRKGIVVLRYWNNDVLSNLPGVLSDLLARVEKLAHAMTTSPTLPLSGGGSAARCSIPSKGKAHD